jgi:hypothetical protein
LAWEKAREKQVFTLPTIERNLSPRIKNVLSFAVLRWPAQRRFETTTGKVPVVYYSKNYPTFSKKNLHENRVPRM